MIPVIAAGAAGLAKLGIGAKLASALGMAKGLVGGAKATQLAIPGLMGAGKAAAAQTAAEGKITVSGAGGSVDLSTWSWGAAGNNDEL